MGPGMAWPGRRRLAGGRGRLLRLGEVGLLQHAAIKLVLAHDADQLAPLAEQHQRPARGLAEYWKRLAYRCPSSRSAARSPYWRPTLPFSAA